MKNRVQLIAYVDGLGGTLAGLTELLTGELDGLFGGIHVLPFFQPFDGADHGFDPVDHSKVDHRLGTWDDVKLLGKVAPVMADLIVNHISADSPQFRDYVAKGARSRYAGMFLTFDRVFPGGATQADLLKLYRPRPGLPFTIVPIADGKRELAWTTFTQKQIDIDVSDPEGDAYLTDILEAFAAHGIRAIRLDAVGYAVKTPGTSCFMTPETMVFIEALTTRARRLGMEVLVEIHSHYLRQLAIADQVDWVYDFALPPLVLHTLFAKDAGPLKRWLELRPTNAVTVLDTHDGIGIVDVAADGDDPGLLDAPAVSELVERIHRNSGGTSRLATGAAASNLDLYQVNCTYYDALGGDDEQYLMARLIQLFVPGVPQVYYVGLLAGGNDTDLLSHTGVGRDINRHRYTPEEVTAAVERPVVRQLFEHIRFRNAHPAFEGDWELLDTSDDILAMRWEGGSAWAELQIDLATSEYGVSYSASS